MRSFRIALALAAGFAVLALTACSEPSGPVFVDDGGAYTQAEAIELLERVESGDIVGQEAAQGAKLRSEALTDLRSHGEAAAGAADLLTSAFGGSASGVPVYVERATYEDTPAIVVVEVIGPKNGELQDKRLWVVAEEDGSVLYSGVR